MANFLLIATSAILLAFLLLYIQRASLQHQVNLRAEALADFVATQSEFGMLTGDSGELNRIAHTALSIEGVLFVVIADRSGDSIRLSRPKFANQDIPHGPYADENFGPVVRAGARTRFREVGRAVLRAYRQLGGGLGDKSILGCASGSRADRVLHVGRRPAHEPKHLPGSAAGGSFASPFMFPVSSRINLRSV